MHADLGSLEEAIGYRFADREILRRALTHSSHAYERSLVDSCEAPAHNEQFEFLGDSVLGLLVSEWLVRHYPSESEGRLSRIKAHLVSAVHLDEVARRLGIGEYLLLGRGEEQSGGRLKRNVITDALEALLGAVYLDGGLEAVRPLVERWVIAESDTPGLIEMLPLQLIDFKGALQELARERKLPQPRYIVVDEHGPQHNRLFTIEVRVGPELTARGQGYTKKSASQKAARQVYERLTLPQLSESGS